MVTTKEQKENLNFLIRELLTPRCRYAVDFGFVLNGNDLRIMCKEDLSPSIVLKAFTRGFEIVAIHEF